MGYGGGYVTGYGYQVAPGTSVRNDLAQFMRLNNGVADNRLVIAYGFRRGPSVGFRSGEGWEKVSTRFMLGSSDRDTAMAATATVWAVQKTASTAVLKQGIDETLNAAGYRKPGGTILG